jgi:hypothetical protein
MGSPIMQYISGNSIITPEETTQSFQVFRDEYTLGGRAHHFGRSSALQSSVDNDWQDKLNDRILKFMEISSRSNFTFRSNYPSSDYPQINKYSIHFQSPPNYEVNEKNTEIDKSQTNYDNISGFKMDICTRCLCNLSAPITSNEFKFEDFHKCDPRRIDLVMNMMPEAYARNFLQNLGNMPQWLFEKCKEWSKNTSGELYLIAKNDDEPKEIEYLNHEFQENDIFPFLKRVLSESKIKLTDADLLEFLTLAVNQTRTGITLNRKPGQAKLKYLLTVTTT